MRQMANFNKDSNGVDNEELEDIGELVEEDYSHEYENLNSTIDELNSCLDNLEQQNDDLYAKLQSLLEDSRQARQELETTRLEDHQQQQGDTDEPDSSDSDGMEAAGYVAATSEQKLENIPESVLSEAIHSAECETTVVSTLASDNTTDAGNMSRLNSNNSKRTVPEMGQETLEHGVQGGSNRETSREELVTETSASVNDADRNLAATSDQNESRDDHGAKNTRTQDLHR